MLANTARQLSLLVPGRLWIKVRCHTAENTHNGFVFLYVAEWSLVGGGDSASLILIFFLFVNVQLPANTSASFSVTQTPWQQETAGAPACKSLC